jgi:non-ribosomal peptide synthetase component F
MLSHQFFERQVERSPDAVAVTFEDRLLTYEKLKRFKDTFDARSI